MSIVKTEAGQKVLKDRSVTLTPRQRSAFILVDGKRSMREVLAASAALGATDEDVERLFELGLIEDSTPPSAAASAVDKPLQPVADPAGEGRSATQRYQDAYPIATRLTAALGLRGFRLNLAVEAAGNYEQLLALSPKIQDAVGAAKFAPLEEALKGS